MTDVAVKGCGHRPAEKGLRPGKAESELEAGAQLGPFRLEAILGRGGQGVVHAAWDERRRCRLALKLVRGPSALREETLQRFQREAHTLAQLDLPGVARIFDVGLLDGAAFMSMELIEGASLAQQIERARQELHAEQDIIFSVDQAGAEVIEEHTPSRSTAEQLPDSQEIRRSVELVARLARILQRVHERGIIHRDLKPGNIMVSRGGQPVLMDFGVAAEIDGDDVSPCGAGASTGTPAYMSPEQLVEPRIRLDVRSDVYSLAVTLFEAITLQRPFEATSRDGLYQAILAKTPPHARRLNPAITDQLAQVLERAMSRDRDLRQPTAEAFAQELQDVLAAHPSGPRRRRCGSLAAFGSRHGTLSITAAACLVLGLAAGFCLARASTQPTDSSLDQVVQAPACVRGPDPGGAPSTSPRIQQRKIPPAPPNLSVI